jgi:hypothetical protein
MFYAKPVTSCLLSNHGFGSLRRDFPPDGSPIHASLSDVNLEKMKREDDELDEETRRSYDDGPITTKVGAGNIRSSMGKDSLRSSDDNWGDLDGSTSLPPTATTVKGMYLGDGGHDDEEEEEEEEEKEGEGDPAAVEEIEDNAGLKGKLLGSRGKVPAKTEALQHNMDDDDLLLQEKITAIDQEISRVERETISVRKSCADLEKKLVSLSEDKADFAKLCNDENKR